MHARAMKHCEREGCLLCSPLPEEGRGIDSRPAVDTAPLLAQGEEGSCPLGSRERKGHAQRCGSLPSDFPASTRLSPVQERV
jgi:hypothetical protein